jgi:hypothetical protein
MREGLTYHIRRITMGFEPVLLVFLILLCNYRFSFKIAALAGIYFYRPDFKFKRDGIFFFYLAMIALGIVNSAFFHVRDTAGQWGVLFTSSLIWTGGLLAYHQIRLFTEKSDPVRLLNTIKVLAVVNLLVSLFDLLKVMVATGAVNPYAQISAPPYGISSGDLIGGVFGGMHLVNTILSAFLLITFIYYGNFTFVLICLIPFLLTGSNFSTLMLAVMLIYAIITLKNTVRKYYALFCLPVIILFYIKVAPENARYMSNLIAKMITREPQSSEVVQAQPANVPPLMQRLDKEQLIQLYLEYKRRQGAKLNSNLNDEHLQIYRKIAHYEQDRKTFEIENTNYVFFKKDSIKNAKLNSEFYEYGKLRQYDFNREAGKVTSFRQTISYLKENPANMMFGAGPGGFSSRMAFISSRIVDDSRLLMLAPKYETAEFRQNHKSIFKYLMFLDDESHSIINLPFSWYNQVAGEYGLLGILAFILLYLLYFVRILPLSRCGRILLPAMIAFFLFDYWFERLSVMVVFEMLMLLDLKFSEEEKRHGSGNGADAGV